MLQEDVNVLDHDDRGINHSANGKSDAAERHDVRGELEVKHRNERKDDGNQKSDDGNERRTDMPKKNQADKCHNDALFDYLLAQRCDGTFDELTSVIGRYEFHAFGEGWFDFRQLLFDALNNPQCIFAVAHYHDSAH